MMYEKGGRWYDDGDEIPMPGTSHPDMGDFSISDDFRKEVFCKLEWNHHNGAHVTERTTFIRKRYMAMAPTTTDPRIELGFYLWDAWVAADGRWVSQQTARLVTRMVGFGE